MTVQELIEQLQTLDPQLEVYADTNHFNFYSNHFTFYPYTPASDVQTMTLTNDEIEMEEGFDTKQVLVITF